MEDITHVLRIGVSACILSISFLSVEVQYMLAIGISNDWISLISYMYEVGFMIGCVFSEKYYTSNVQKTAVILAYTLSILSGTSLSIYSIFNNKKGLQSIVVLGYTLSGIGQSLLIIVMIAYATPYAKKNPRSALIPLLLGLLNFSGLIGAVINYFTYINYFTPGYFLLAINLILLLISVIISWRLKGNPRYYIIGDNLKPEIPFGNFTVSFYTYGFVFGIYSSVLPRTMFHYHHLNSAEELCLFQAIYSLCYLIGAAVVSIYLYKEKQGIGKVIFAAGTVSSICGVVVTNLHDLNKGSGTVVLPIVFVSDVFLGFLDGILEPLIMHKIVTQTNRPEFFTGNFYFLSSISSIMVISLPSNLNNEIYAMFFIMITLTSLTVNR